LAGVADTIQETGKGKPVAWINKDLKTYTTRPGIPQLLGSALPQATKPDLFQVQEELVWKPYPQLKQRIEG